MKSIILTNSLSNNKVNNKNGVVYTPNFIVKNMLNTIGYKNKAILKKHIIDNSCGEGAFLVEIVNRYLKVAKKIKLSNKEIINDLEKFIHGIEIDFLSRDICINNLNDVLLKYGITQPVKWDILRGDTLKIKKFNNKMDYVVGNPPYIRIHDLDIDYKKFSFASKGMTDLYLIFFELSINMLSKNGEMIYITPNSFFTSKAASKFRNFVIDNKILKKIINLGHFNPFKGITTYPAITLLSKKTRNKKIEYFEYDKQFFKNKLIEKLKYNDFFINESFYFGNLKDLEKFREIISVDKNPFIAIKNAVSTNLDFVFFDKKYKGKFINDAIKISKMENTKVFFPYDRNGKLISLEKIKQENIDIYKILLKNKIKLNLRSLQNQQWYEFARTQGIVDVYKPKMIINNIIKNIETIKTKVLDPGIVPYSGYYLISDKYKFNFLEQLLKDNDFIEYLKILRKDKNGEYYFFSSTDLHLYISYKILKLEE